MMKKRTLGFVAFWIAALIVSGCARFGGPKSSEPLPATEDPSAPVDSGEASPLDPIPGEEQMSRGEVGISESDVLLLESYPLQVVLALKGTMPTPCHHLRAKVSPPDTQLRIQVEVYSLADPAEICIQVIEEFDVNLPLGSYPDGSYTIWVNGEQVGEFKQ
jgi:hypothetical protein